MCASLSVCLYVSVCVSVSMYVYIYILKLSVVVQNCSPSTEGSSSKLACLKNNSSNNIFQASLYIARLCLKKKNEWIDLMIKNINHIMIANYYMQQL